VIEDAKNWRVHTADVLDTLQTAADAMPDQETGVRGHLIKERFLESYRRGGNAYTAVS
jgi:CHASE3 domain sensor protein